MLNNLVYKYDNHLIVSICKLQCTGQTDVSVLLFDIFFFK